MTLQHDHDSDAISRLLSRIPSDPVNLWKAAEEAIEGADDETVRVAARDLLGLYLHTLRDTEAQIAMRNVRDGDYVRLHGIVAYVCEVVDRAPSRSPQRSITLQVKYHRPNGPSATFAYDADVRIPLVARDHQEHCRSAL